MTKMLPVISDYCGGPHNLIRGSALFVIVLLFYWYDIRPYGLLSIIFLVFILTERVRNESTSFKYPTISEKSLQEIKKFRTDHPGKFCAFSSASFVLLAILGNIISGPLFLILVAVCVFGKKYIPDNVKQVCKQATWASNDNEVEDFLPELNASNLALLTLAKEAGSKNDSDVESDKTEAFLLDKTPNLSESSSECGDDVVSPTNEDIQFLSSHFNGDGSSTDEDSFEKGLNFREKNVTFKDTQERDQVDKPQSNIMSDIMSNVTGMPWSLVSNLISTASTTNPPPSKRKINRQDSESDSEFELVECDELNIT